MKFLVVLLSLTLSTAAIAEEATNNPPSLVDIQPETDSLTQAAPETGTESVAEAETVTVAEQRSAPVTELPAKKTETALSPETAPATETATATATAPAAPATTPAKPAPTAEQMEVSSKSASEGEIEKLQYLTAAIQEDLKTMSVNAKEVVQTTSTIGKMMLKMREIDARAQQKPISDANLAVDPRGNNLEKLKLKFEDFKDEHWSRFNIPNFEYRFFKRDRDLVTVQNPVTLKKILEGIHAARSKFLPANCFDRQAKAVVAAPVCQRRLAICGQSGFEAQEKQLVAYQVNQDFQLEAKLLATPEDAEEVLGQRYDTSSDRATLLSDETFYFCKLASRFGAIFKAEPLTYPAEVASK